jgi:hypothetical protein
MAFGVCLQILLLVSFDIFVLISLFKEYIFFLVVFICSREPVPLLAYMYMPVYPNCWFPALFHF